MNGSQGKRSVGLCVRSSSELKAKQRRSRRRTEASRDPATPLEASYRRGRIWRSGIMLKFLHCTQPTVTCLFSFSDRCCEGHLLRRMDKDEGRQSRGNQWGSTSRLCEDKETRKATIDLLSPHQCPALMNLNFHTPNTTDRNSHDKQTFVFHSNNSFSQNKSKNFEMFKRYNCDLLWCFH